MCYAATRRTQPAEPAPIYADRVTDTPDVTQIRAVLAAPVRLHDGCLRHGPTRRLLARGDDPAVLRAAAAALTELYRSHVADVSDAELARRIRLARDTEVGGLVRDFLAAEQQVRRELDLAATLPEADSDDRYTFAPVYVPGRVDTWDTWAREGTLRRAVHDLARNPDRAITLQHGDVVVGERLDLVVWPFEHSTVLRQMNGDARQVAFPAGTPWMGVKWTAEAWPSVLAGHVRGYSIEGRAVHVPSDGPTGSV